MSLVWPWIADADPTPLVDSFGRDIGISPALEIHAPRTDVDVALVVWSEPGAGFVIGADWSASVARVYSGTLQSRSPIALNGATGQFARILAGSETVWRIAVPRDQAVVHLEVRVPQINADAYWLQIETMLATWGWDD